MASVDYQNEVYSQACIAETVEPFASARVLQDHCVHLPAHTDYILAAVQLLREELRLGLILVLASKVLAAQQFVGSLGRVRCMVHIEGVGHRSCAGCHKPTAAGGTLGSQVGAVHKLSLIHI